MEPYPDPDEEEDENHPYDPNDYERQQERYEKDMERWTDPD